MKTLILTAFILITSCSNQQEDISKVLANENQRDNAIEIILNNQSMMDAFISKMNQNDRAKSYVIQNIHTSMLYTNALNTTSKGKYSCPMHPNEVSNTLINCSKCGMSLTLGGKGSKDSCCSSK